MPPVIGVSGKIVTGSRWYKDIAATDFDAIEIIRRKNHLPFHPENMKHVIDYLSDRDLSIHSGTMRIFNDDPMFSETELSIIRGEIYMARYLGIREIIFHLRNRALIDDEKRKFGSLMEFARENGVDLIYEGNSKMDGHVVMDFFKSFPELNFNLDLGHLNLSLTQDKLGFTLEEFISRLRDRIIYVHAHNNHGKSDQHFALDNGTLDYEYVLSLLDMERVRKIIIEVHKLEHALKSREILQNIL